MILIVTNKRDLTSDYVVLELEKRGRPFFRLNTETVATGDISFVPGYGQRGWTLNLSDASIQFREVTSAYYRRPEPPHIPDSVTEQAARFYCQEEWQETLRAALNSLGDRWLNRPNAIYEAENKPRQLCVALECGLKIPKTLITNSFERAKEFVESETCIAKPLKAALVRHGLDERVIFTSRVNEFSAEMRDALQISPVILQVEIPKAFDLRVIVVGEKVFAVEIHSQGCNETIVDWRRGSKVDLRHVVHALPALVANKCIHLTRQLGLKFSAIDLILDRAGEYWFLEANPNGQWAWLQSRVGLPISEAIANELDKGLLNA